MATDNVARGLAAHALSVAVAGGGEHPVESVNGKTGKVNLTAADVGAEPAGSAAKFVINLTEDAENGVYTADKTWAQIKAAYEGNKVLSVHIGSSELPMINGQISDGAAGFTFGYTNIIADGTAVHTRAIHYLYTDSVETWEDADAEGEYLPVSGGTMAGALLLAADPVSDTGAATKKYVDDRRFKVTFQRDPVAGLNADHSFADIFAAVTDNKDVVAVLDNNEYPLTYAAEAEMIFSGSTGSISTEIIYADGAWTQTTVSLLPTSGGTMTGNIDMGGQNLINAQKVHVDGAAPLYIGSTIEASGTAGARLTGTTSGDAAFVKADTQADYIPVYVGTPTAPNHAVNLAYLTQEVKDDSATKNHVTVEKNAAITIGMSDGVYFVSACDSIHRGLSVVYMCGSTTTFSALSGMAGWEISKGAVDNSLYINNKSDAAALEVYIVAIGAGSAY